MTTFAGHLLTGDHASRPAANTVPDGTLYSCTDHGIVYQADEPGNAWNNWATITGAVPGAHAASHQNGGSDEISVAGLSGLLADDQNPVAHAADHETGGSDPIDLSDQFMPIGGGTFTGDIAVPDEAYDATTWNGNNDVPTKNAIRDKIETLGGGSSVVVQVVSTQTGATATGSVAIPVDDTIPQNTEGTEFMTLAVTPTDAANKLQIDIVIFLTGPAAKWLIVALFQDTTANALAVGAAFNETNTAGMTVKFTHHMVAGTTSATTFKVRAGCHDATAIRMNGQGAVRLWGGVVASSITITEIIP